MTDRASSSWEDWQCRAEWWCEWEGWGDTETYRCEKMLGHEGDHGSLDGKLRWTEK